jgi:hypothetical protein
MRPGWIRPYWLLEVGKRPESSPLDDEWAGRAWCDSKECVPLYCEMKGARFEEEGQM